MFHAARGCALQYQGFPQAGQDGWNSTGAQCQSKHEQWCRAGWQAVLDDILGRQCCNIDISRLDGYLGGYVSFVGLIDRKEAHVRLSQQAFVSPVLDHLNHCT